MASRSVQVENGGGDICRVVDGESLNRTLPLVDKDGDTHYKGDISLPGTANLNTVTDSLDTRDGRFTKSEAINGDDKGVLVKGVNKITIPRLTLPGAKSGTQSNEDNLLGVTLTGDVTSKQPTEDIIPDEEPNSNKNDEDLMSNLSPTTQEQVNIFLKDLSNGVAELDIDPEGKQKIVYKQAKKLFWDGSNANVIAVPKSEIDLQQKVDSVLELVRYMKTEKPPSGVVLDSSKISLSKKKEYRLGHEFVRTEKVLGSGNSAGDIIVLKDKKTGEEHAHKTMMISCFGPNEIKCWVQINDTGYVPRLYMFKIEGNKMSVHMEILRDAKTLRSIIDEKLVEFDLSESSRSLIRPFSLFVLDGALEALTEMHKKNWVHKDLHPGNAMVQKKSENTLGVKILDFGLAGPFESPTGLDHRGFKSDISEVLRMFSALYSGGLEFDNTYDIQKNWRQQVADWSDMTNMSVEQREELCILIESAMQLVEPSDVQQYKDMVKQKLQNAMGDQASQDKIMRKVVNLLFPEEFIEIHEHSHVDMDCADSSNDVVDSLGFGSVSRDSGHHVARDSGFHVARDSGHHVARDSCSKDSTCGDRAITNGSHSGTDFTDNLLRRIRMQISVSVQPC